MPATVAKCYTTRLVSTAGILTKISLHKRSGAEEAIPSRPAARPLGAMSQIPTKNGAAAAVGMVLQSSRASRWFAVEVPIINVSGWIHLHRQACHFREEVTRPVQARQAAGADQGILAYNEAPMVSWTSPRCPLSGVRRDSSPKVIEGHAGQRCAPGYDNELGILQTA